MPKHFQEKRSPRRFRAAVRLSVAVTNARRGFRPDAVGLGRLVRTVLEGEGIRTAEISVALVDNRIMRRLNRRFLRHDQTTDVLSFRLDDARESLLRGEIVVSADVARKSARRFGHSARAEVALYVLHGLLHLAGYDDRRTADRERMRAREQHYLGRLGIRLKGGVEE